MKKIVLSLSLCTLLACGSQKMLTGTKTQNTSERVEKPETKPQKSPLMAEANITLTDFKSGSNKAWFERGYNAYSPDQELVNAFGKAMKNHDYQIDVYMGTWCGDSRREVPRLYKLLEMIDFDMDKLSVVAVNHAKQIPNVSPEVANQLNIRHVPTIIFYENGKETERFVESATESLVKDLTKIASGEIYLDSYGR